MRNELCVSMYVTSLMAILEVLLMLMLLFYLWFFSRGSIELGDVTVHNIKQLKRINEVVFPVVYNDKFYKDILEVGELAKLGTRLIYIFISNLTLLTP